MENELQRAGGGFRDQVFTPAEIAYCEGKRYPARHYAARFAAKEAVLKALAVRAEDGMLYRSAEVGNDCVGRPFVTLHGALSERSGRLGVKTILLTLSHTPNLATANVVLEA